MYYVYILQLRNKTYYHGFSEDLKMRLKSHEQGSVTATKDFRPVKLVFYASFPSAKLAQQFEKYLKTPSGSAFRNKHLI